VTSKLESAPGPVVAVSDYMRAVPLQISSWVPQDFHALGTDGFGFADTRPAARRFFQVDAESVTVAALRALADRGEVKPEVVAEAFAKYRVDDPTAVADVKQEGGDA
jgi:pyruvate dehydrogenase E1 component